MGRLIGRDSVTILRAQTSEDPYSGTQALDWSLPPAETVVANCEVQPGASQEYLLNRDYTLIAWTVFAPAGTDVTALDRVRYRGVEYDVDGVPGKWDYIPGGRLNYVEIALKRRDG